MEFALTQDQLALQSAVADLIKAHADLSVVRSVVDDPDGDGDPAGLWRRMADQGWPALLVPEEYGGLGLDLLDAAVIARALGAAVVPTPFVPATVAGRALALAGSTQQKERWLPASAEGTARLGVALRDPSSAVRTTGEGVTVEGDALTGVLPQVEYAHVVDRLVVAAEDGSLWLVDPTGDGVAHRRTPLLDGTTRTSTVTLTGAPGERLPADEGVAEQLRLAATALYANDLAGIAREAVTRTVEYLKTREQFGRLIGSFQALQHRMADLLVAVTMSEHVALYAAYAPDEFSVGIAKAKAGDTAVDATKTMIQHHGGIGFTWEHDAHFYFKRAERLQQVFGDAGQHRSVIAELTLAASA